MARNRHVHQRRDGVVLICMKPWCAPSRWCGIVGRALLVTAPLAVVAAAIALGPRSLGIALALIALAAFVTYGTRRLAARIERDAMKERSLETRRGVHGVRVDEVIRREVDGIA